MCNSSTASLHRRTMLAAAVLSLLPGRRTRAQAAAAWLAAADPFQKFVHEVLEFTKYVINRADKKHEARVKEAAPRLANEMHQIAALKREFAAEIDAAVSSQLEGSKLRRIATRLNDSVSELQKTIKDVDPTWLAQHNELSMSVARMEVQKVAASQRGLDLVGRSDQRLDPEDAKQFSEQLRELSKQLDGAGSDISTALK